jgi:membrane-associated phospholipid phosphatase
MPPELPSQANGGAAERARWQARLRARARRWFLVKAACVTAFIWLFFVAYFHLLRHPSGEVAVMPLLWLDRAIPFEPAALYVYLSLWFYVGIAPGLMFTLRNLLTYGLWMVVLSVAGLSIFHFWPTAVPMLEVDVVLHPTFALLRGVDAAGNACPSMHVATAIFAAIRLGQVLHVDQAPRWLHAVNAGWFLAIAWSTVAVRQHVVLDVLAGAALGALVAIASMKWPGTRGIDPFSLDRIFRRLR